MRKHRTVQLIGILIMLAAAAYLVLGVLGIAVLGRQGLGGGWSAGWRGWVTIPALIATIFGFATLLIFGALLFFLAKINTNLEVARRRSAERPAIAPVEAHTPAAVAPTLSPTGAQEVLPAPPVEMAATTPAVEAPAPPFVTEVAPVTEEVVTAATRVTETEVPVVEAAVEAPTVEALALPFVTEVAPVTEKVVAAATRVTETEVPVVEAAVEAPTVEAPAPQLEPEVALITEEVVAAVARVTETAVPVAEIAAEAPQIAVETVMVLPEASLPPEFDLEVGEPERIRVAAGAVAAEVVTPSIVVDRVDTEPASPVIAQETAAPEEAPAPAEPQASASTPSAAPVLPTIEIETIEEEPPVVSVIAHTPEIQFADHQETTADNDLAALRAQVAALQARLAQLESAGAQATEAAASSVAEASQVSRLPGAEDAARIAAEMAALQPSKRRPAPSE